MTHAPRISVVLAVFNGETYLPEAIRSVLAQTFHDFECIIIDDGSTDGTAGILEQFQRQDRRIRLVRQSHSGLVDTLNRGMEIAVGEYIARMDADDICAPERLETQVRYMDVHHDVGVCGTWVETFGNGPGRIVRYPCDDATIRACMLFACTFAHPTVMLRRDMLARHSLWYDGCAIHAEDYDLWVRASQYTRFANIPAALLRYRVHSQQVGRRHEMQMEASSQRIRVAQLIRLGLYPTPEEAVLHQKLSRWEFESSSAFLQATRGWLTKLIDANASVQIYPGKEFLGVLGQRWADVCLSATQKGLRTLIEFWQAPILAMSVWSLKEHFKFVVKCLIRKDLHTPFMKTTRVTN